MDIETWITHFNEQSTVLQLNPLEKFVYARKLMAGNAKLFTDYESNATSIDMNYKRNSRKR